MVSGFKTIHIKMKSLILAAILLASCYTDRVGMYLSTTERPREFGGTSENYEPKRVHGELENRVNSNVSIINYTQLGTDDNKLDVAIGTGVKLRYSFLYSNFGAGLGYVTEEFSRQDPKLNFHLLAGLGVEVPYDDCKFVLGRYFDHFSVGRDINPLVSNDQKNDGINWRGTKFGMNCKF